MKNNFEKNKFNKMHLRSENYPEMHLFAQQIL